MRDGDTKETKVFVSYAREDSHFVTGIVQLLRGLNLDAFVDRDIRPGQKWATVIWKELESCHVVIVFWSEHAARSDWVKREYQRAISLGKTVLPAQLTGAPLPEELTEYQAVSLFEPTNEAEEAEDTLKYETHESVAQPADEPQKGQSDTPEETTDLFLLIEPGEGAPFRYKCGLGRDVTVGRSIHAEIVIPNDSGLSRKHARFFPIANRWLIDDLGSRNAIFVNGSILTGPTLIEEGDVITMSDCSIRVESIRENVVLQENLVLKQRTGDWAGWDDYLDGLSIGDAHLWDSGGVQPSPTQQETRAAGLIGKKLAALLQ